jgi:hypothetical protein
MLLADGAGCAHQLKPLVAVMDAFCFSYSKEYYLVLSDIYLEQ